VGLLGAAKANPHDLKALRALLESGQVVPVIDRCYPLAQVPDALRYLETGRALGKVVITVAQAA
jgi:NADPH:quinone reductase-like Zn-dependent oxidoreductase